MSYLLDTCVLSELRKPAPNANVVDWVNGIDPVRFYLSVVAIAEIQKGVSKLNHSAKQAQLQRWPDEDLPRYFSGRILPVDEGTAFTWGRFMGEAQQRGQPVPVMDALVAATAATNHLSVVTRNTTDFTSFPIDLVDPWSEADH